MYWGAKRDILESFFLLKGKNRKSSENPLLPGVTKLISILFFGDINWAKMLVLLK